MVEKYCRFGLCSSNQVRRGECECYNFNNKQQESVCNVINSDLYIMENSIIKKLYSVFDNSYSITIGSNKNPLLAGTNDTPSVGRVVIVSEPYKHIIINVMEREEILTFINVQCNGQIHRVLYDERSVR